MISRGNPRFWASYRQLPPEARHLARKAYQLFRANPAHPSLRFKSIHGTDSVYSIRISLHYRALGVVEGAQVIWFWIGTHAEYDRLLATRR